MKRMWAAAGLLVFCILLSVLGIGHTAQVTAQMEEIVRSAKTAQMSGDEGHALQFSEKAVTRWRESHRILCLYMAHDKLEAIDQTLALLPELCKADQKDSFLSECDHGLTQISYLNESEIPSLENIL